MAMADGFFFLGGTVLGFGNVHLRVIEKGLVIFCPSPSSKGWCIRRKGAEP